MRILSALFALICVAPVSARDNPGPVPADEKVLILDPFMVKARPISSYPFDIRIYVHRDTKKVERMFITRVLEDTEAEKAGLRPGDEIVKVDGVAVRDMDARVVPDSELGRIFLNRAPGGPLQLEVIIHRTEKFTLHAVKNPLPPVGN